MEKSFAISASAKNTVFHRTASFVLDGDGNFSDASRSNGREYRNEADAIACFEVAATQVESNAFTAHTDVTFELVETSENEEGDFTQRTIKSTSFKVEEAA